jgi:hypothetical protein
MAWIRTIPLEEANENLRKALEEQKLLYPKEYATPVHPSPGGGSSEIVASHSFIPCIRNLRRSHVARLTSHSPSTRNDYDHGLGHEPVRLLNRVTRRVSASGDVG